MNADVIAEARSLRRRVLMELIHKEELSTDVVIEELERHWVTDPEVFASGFNFIRSDRLESGSLLHAVANHFFDENIPTYICWCISKGLSVHERDTGDFTPLEGVLARYLSDEILDWYSRDAPLTPMGKEVFTSLLKAGADVDEANPSTGATPYEFAMLNLLVCPTLLELLGKYRSTPRPAKRARLSTKDDSENQHSDVSEWWALMASVNWGSIDNRQ